ncbi:putative conjugal transfer protein TraG (plasmid) [Aureimonas sp. SA4125]|uniref:Ti-type conjugative transfer system protein TraG n=1 Tax=Aureimonas sp. SA4125 TaxID=2826993 RepID=UPI001CC57525|nr:Ti-type conjugative transfer system protein TraG [Aureimonas sp. SA4125]BDA87187.1 putative conjugal transfer protein TraG [Aureimonas sp. SA4125]
MKPSRLALLVAPPVMMVGACVGFTGMESTLAAFGSTTTAQRTFGQIGIALPYIAGGAIGFVFLFACAGSVAIRAAGWGAFLGSSAIVVLATMREAARVHAFTDRLPAGEQIIGYVDPATVGGGAVALLCGVFALRVALKGNAAFAEPRPRRLRGKRAVHGESDWMSMTDAGRLLPDAGGIVVGERSRVDKDSVANRSFRADDRDTWGGGGRASLLCFDGAFGSTHGIVFAGSGGFKTTSVTIPTALKWGSALVALDPSNEVAPMVSAHRRAAGRGVFVLDPKSPEIGFNALDWIGRHGGTKEEDIASVASWIITDMPRAGSAHDDFFRASALQLLTALIADVCLSGHTEPEHQHLRQVRANLAEPEPKLRGRLQAIYDSSESDFVKENVAPFIAMTPETFSGVYANAVKETHWLSYANYAAIVSGSSFTTEELATGGIDVFINLDLKTLENHPGLARVIIGSFLNAIYNRNGAVRDRTLFLLDEVARLGYLRILETARDAGRKYGITLVMLFQSIGQMREAYGGRDASSKWFESVSWMSFAAINDPETADYISKRCGDTTIEVDQISRSSKMGGSSRTRSKQLSRRPLILPHEVMQMRADEQIVFTAGNPPLRCGRAIYFRRRDMSACVGENRFHRKEAERNP